MPGGALHHDPSQRALRRRGARPDGGKRHHCTASSAISVTNARVAETLAAPFWVSGSRYRWRQASARSMRSAHWGNSCRARHAASRLDRRSPDLIAYSPRHIVRIA